MELRNALDQLAADVPPPPPAPDLWARGVRRRRRTRTLAAAGVLAGVAGGAGVASVVTDRPSPPPVASALDELALPDRLWSPSPWLEGTDELGPPGPVAMLFWDNMRRSTWWGGERGGFVAVSAVDGSYRYLDELGGVNGFGPVLSPDGRYVAFPSLSEAPPADGAELTADGYAVYDALTGEVVEQHVGDAPLGIDADLPLVWTPDSAHVLVDVCRIDDADASGFSCTGVGTDVLNVGTGEVRRLPTQVVLDVVGRSDDSLLVQRARGRLGTLDVESGQVTPVGRLDSSGMQQRSSMYLDEAAGTVTVATQVDNDSSGQLSLARVPVAEGRSSEAAWRPAPVDGNAEVLGPWRDRGLLLLQSQGRESAVRGVELRGQGEGLAATSVTTVVSIEDEFTGSALQVADVLGGRPFADRPAPDEPMDPRLLPGAGLALLAGAAVWLLRRRR